MSRLTLQDRLVLLAVILFALGMGGIWIAMHGFGDQVGVGFALGLIVGIALTLYATGSRGGAGR